MKTQALTMLFAAGLAACATAPKTASEKASLENEASSTLATMMQKDPALASRLHQSAGYAVFPSIGKGGFIAGAAYGRGVQYENGRKIGYVELNQGSLGAQIGAESFAELILFQTPHDVDRIKQGELSIAGNASAVLLTSGAAAGASFQDGVAVLVMPHGGAMAEVSVSGQKINFVPRG